MLLNEDIVDTEKPDGICCLNFVVDEFSGLLLHPSIFSVIHSRSAQIMNDALSDLWYWLNSNILVSSEGMFLLQKSLFSNVFLCNSSFFFCCERMKGIQN